MRPTPKDRPGPKGTFFAAQEMPPGSHILDGGGLSQTDGHIRSYLDLYYQLYIYFLPEQTVAILILLRGL